MKSGDLTDWKAHWIWQPTEDPGQPNTYVYFRRTFELDAPLEKARLRVSADTCYRLFLNGTLVGWGPVMTEPRWQTFDTYEIGPLLKSGTNVIGAVVYHYGNAPDNPGANTYFWSRGGFLCQLDLDPAAEPLLTDAAWQVLESTAWRRDVPKMDRMTFCELFDAAKEPVGWLEPDFDRQGWQQAVVVTDPLMKEWAWNPAASVKLPWFQLDERPIPAFVVESRPPQAILYAGEVLERAESYYTDDLAVRMSLEQPLPARMTRIDGCERLLEGPGKAQAVIVHPMDNAISYDDFAGVHDPCLALDAGRLLNGRVRLEVSAPAGAIIDVGYSQILVDDRVVPYLSHRTPMADQFRTREGRQVLATYNWRNFRYVLLVFRNLVAPLTIHSIGIGAERYPYERTGAFESSDEMLNWVWKACVDTTELCTYDRFMDNPNRERREYVGDILCVLHGVYAAFGNPAIVGKYFTDIRRATLAYGPVPHTILGNKHEQLSLHAESTLELILHVWEHYRLCGELSLVRDFYPVITGHLRLLDGFTDEQGLLGQSPFTVYIDWADVDRRGTNLVVNALYVQAMRIAAGMARELGAEPEAREFEERAERLTRLLSDLYWDAERGVFCDCLIDGARSEHVSEHANFLMMLFQMASDEQCAAIARALEEPAIDTGQVEPGFFWAVEGLFRRGQAVWAVEMIRRRYGRMRRQGLDTIAEVWQLLGERYPGRWRSRDSRSAAQACGVTAAYLLSRYVLGIEPETPGFAAVSIAPHCANLEWAKGVWPSPRGPIRVSWRRGNEGRFNLECELPEGVGGTVVVPEPFIRTAEVVVNGRTHAVARDGTVGI